LTFICEPIALDNIGILKDGKIIQKGNPQDIIMKPADDYISDFIKDVNRGKVIKVETIMKTGSCKGSDIASTLPLENALQMLNKTSIKECNVIDTEGKKIGIVSLNRAISALSTKNKKIVKKDINNY